MSAISTVRPAYVVLLLLAAALLVALTFAPASFAADPGTSGQPSQSCGSATASVEPAGFLTTGFTAAALLYAGAGTSADHAVSSNAVSQYDVACFQLTSSSH